MASLPIMAIPDQAVEIQKRLDRLRRSRRWLAGLIDVSPQKLNGWLNGDHQPVDYAMWGRIDEALDKHDPALSLVSSPAPGSDPPSPGLTPGIGAQLGVGRRKFPILGCVGASSHPVESPEADPDDYVEFSDDLYRSDRFGLRVIGDSNFPYIRHKDEILVQPAKVVASGLFVVFRSPEFEYLVKLKGYDAGRVAYQPLNPSYEEIIPADGWELVGYVVGLRRLFGRKSYLEFGDDDGLRLTHFE